MIEWFSRYFSIREDVGRSKKGIDGFEIGSFSRLAIQT